LLANTAIDHTFGEINPMTKKDDYKLNAARTVNLANRAATVADKGHLPDLAENGSILPIARMKCSSARSATKARRANILCCAASSAPSGAKPGKIRLRPLVH
jgi:hypothetical protein